MRFGRHGFGAVVSAMLRMLSLTATALPLTANLYAAPPASPAPPPLDPPPYIWKSVAIHGGGFVSGIIPHPSVPGLMYARTDVGGAYRWDAGSKSWVAITDWISQSDGNLMGCESIAVDPSEPDRVYLALGMYTNSWGKNGAIVRSNDRGRTFERTDMPFKMGGNCPGRSMGERLVVDPNDGQILFFGSRSAGLWKSVDQAKTWARVESFPQAATEPASTDAGNQDWPLGISFVRFDASSGARGNPTPVIYAGVCTLQTSFFRSSDGGSTWSAVPGQPVGFRPNHMVISPAGLISISYGDQAGPNGMLDGAIWQFNSRTSRWTNITPVKPSPSDRFGYGAVALDAQHPGTLMASSMDRWTHGDTVFRSIDDGRTWTSQTVGGGNNNRSLFDASDAPWGNSLKPHWLGDIEIDPFDPNHVLFVTGFGIWATHEASTLDAGKRVHWSFEDRGLEETVPLGLVSPPSGPHLISVIGDFDGFTHDELNVSPPRGRHQPSVGSTSGLDFAGKMPSRIVRAGGHGSGFYSEDGGQTWTAFSSLPARARSGGEIAISSDGRIIVWTPGGTDTIRSTDLGRTWSPCQGLPHPLPVIADRVDSNRFYALDNRAGQVFVSDDGGSTFALAAKNLPRGDGSLQAVPDDAGELWLVADRQLLHSADAGRAFTRITTSDKTEKVGFGKAPAGKDYSAIFISGVVNGTEGLFRSDDAAQTWVRIDDDQHRFGWLNVLIGDPRVYGRVYVGTGGRGIVYGDVTGATQ
jgi:photosystem II stability/assembly factor-like uncharacterized protein